MRATKRKTVLAYVGSASDRLSRAISAAARCDGVTERELVRIRRLFQSAYRLEMTLRITRRSR